MSLFANGDTVYTVRDITGDDLGYPDYGVMINKDNKGEIIEAEYVDGELDGFAVRFETPFGPVEWSMDAALVVAEDRYLLNEVRERLEREYHLFYSQYIDPDGDIADVLASANDMFEELITQLGGDPVEVVSDLHSEEDEDAEG